MSRREEQETLFSIAADQDRWLLWTTEPGMIRRIERMMTNPRRFGLSDYERGKDYVQVRVARDRVKIRPVVGRSEAQERASKRLADSRRKVETSPVAG